MLQICPLYSRAEEEASAQTKDIQIIDNPYEFGKHYVRNKADEYKKIKVSNENIKERLLKGEPVYFVEKQVETKRTIKSEWIANALKKRFKVKKIDIRNAIVTGDLDFHIKNNLVNIDEGAMGVDEIKKKQKYGGPGRGKGLRPARPRRGGIPHGREVGFRPEGFGQVCLLPRELGRE